MNAPKCPAHNYHKDGAMRFVPAATGSPDACCEPNSFGGAKQDPAVTEPSLRVSGDAARYFIAAIRSTPPVCAPPLR